MVTREEFDQQRKRRFGWSNPERHDFAHWEWMVRTRFNAYQGREKHGVSRSSSRSSYDRDWCFDRFGTSLTRMPDGRLICVGGEHEDWYDSDFCIYNDVIVLRPAPGEEMVTETSGGVEIYGYPEEVFPPTDFHTATLVGGTIYLIGRLGYDREPTFERTPVYMLDTVTYRIEEFQTTRESPWWVYKHHASYDAARHAITVRGGLIPTSSRGPTRPNFSVHRLHLADRRWEVVTARERYRMFTIPVVSDEISWPKYDRMLIPNVRHTLIEPRRYAEDPVRVDVEGVPIEIVDRGSEINVDVQGELPNELVTRILEDLIASVGLEPQTIDEVVECDRNLEP
jgi:hypothetical protein